MIHITSLTRGELRSRQHPLPRTSIRSLSFASMILCLLHRVCPVPPVQMPPRYSFRLISAPAQPETILRENSQSSAYETREFVVEREGEMPTFIKSSTSSTPQSALPNPNEFRQWMSSTPVSVSSFPIYDAGDDEIPRSRSLDPIQVTRSKKKGTTGKKKRTSKPEGPAS